MILNIDVKFDYRMTQSTDVIMQIQAAELVGQKVIEDTIEMSDVDAIKHVPAESGIGQRMLLRTKGDLICSYHAKIAVTRPVHALETLNATPPHQLPGDAVRYLMPSRYCLPDDVDAQVGTIFNDLSGGARIAAISSWIYDTFQYDIAASNAGTSAIDSVKSHRGVCRDYAHVLISLARAAAIPARFASVYAPNVTPQDFHAVAEVYLDGAWHFVDATGMARADQIVCIGVGMDAAEVSFLSSFGLMDLHSQTVQVTASA